MTWRERQGQLLDAVNGARTQGERDAAEQFLKGFREAVALLSGIHPGLIIMAGDEHYLDQGIDRPMCGGSFLDWEPAPPTAPVEGA
jgi:hypothetical protein